MKTAIIFLMFVCIAAEGGFQGFPVPTNSDWTIANTNHYMSQLYSSIVERCEVADYAPLDIVETWYVFDKMITNTVAWTNGATVGIYTNIYPTNMTVTTTNQIGPFEYEADGSVTYTGMPFVTRYFINQLDAKIIDLMSCYLAYNAASNSTAWHKTAYTSDIVYSVAGTDHTNTATIYPITSIPYETPRNLFTHAKIGYVESPISNQFNIVTNGTAYWTRQPPMTNQWVLAETHYTGAWSYVEISQFEKRLYSTNTPVLKYIMGGTNPLTGSFDVTINGTFLNVTNQTTPAGSEIVSISSTNETATTKPWYNISSISVAANFNTNDTVSLYYNGSFTLYGWWPYTLYAADLNERYEAIKRLKYIKSKSTLYIGEYANGFWPDVYNEGRGLDDDYSVAISKNIADYGVGPVSGGMSGIIQAWYQWSGEYLVRSKAGVSTNDFIYSRDVIATNRPYTWEYYSWCLEYYYGQRQVSPPLAITVNGYYEWYDPSGITLAPDIVDGNKYSLYAVVTNATASTQLVYDAWIDAIDTANPVVAPGPTLDTSVRVSFYHYDWNIRASTFIGIGGEQGNIADGCGWFYLNYDFEYE